MGLFSSSKKTSNTTSLTKSVDARLGVEGISGGQVIGAGANVSMPGSIATRIGDMSTVTQNLSGQFKMGMSGTEVAGLLSQKDTVTQKIAESQAASASKMAELALGTLATAKTGDLADWTRYLPYVVLAGAVVLIARERRR